MAENHVTPQESQPELAKALGLKSLYFKREDLHPYKSHKGRSIPRMIDTYLTQGFKNFIISSSGNAALAAALYSQEKGVGLDIYVGKKIDEEKLDALKKLEADPEANGPIRVEQVERPLQEVFKALKKRPDLKELRQSTDDSALAGYESLAKELATIPDLEAVFVPTSSGTTAEALALNFEKLLSTSVPQIHIVQTTAVHPIADEFDRSLIDPENAAADSQKKSLAGAIADKTGYRKKAVAEAIRETKGGAWIVSNDEIIEAVNMVKEKTGLNISTNSALSVAGLIKAKRNGSSWNGSVVCLVTGA